MISGPASAEDLVKQAEALLQARKLSSALLAFDRAEAAGARPDRCAAGRWSVHMLVGDMESAWRESDAIRKRGTHDPNRFWNGKDIAGRQVILRCLHGLGDAVQFLRYAPRLRERAANLIVEAPPALFALAPMFVGVTQVVTWGEHAPANPPRWDVQVEINELAYLFRTKSQDLPIAQHYLKLPPKILQAAAPTACNPSNLRVGIVWASGEWNPKRSLSLRQMRPLLDVPGCEFWNLQGGPARSQWRTLSSRAALHDAEFCANSLPHLAALIAQLDLVVTPDTLAAHLAGALGTPAWVLLEHAADWRWQHARNDSPWYPSLRLFRQQSAGDWQTVIDQVRQELHACRASHLSLQTAA